jgi:hypothetical protein
MSNDDTIQDFIYGDGQPDGATVREILTLAYGDDWEQQLSDVVTVANVARCNTLPTLADSRTFDTTTSRSSLFATTQRAAVSTATRMR